MNEAFDPAVAVCKIRARNRLIANAIQRIIFLMKPAAPRPRKAADISVKSSMRTLEILEYCDSVQRAVTVSEIVERLGYPQSSTSVLVQSMVNAGYLTHDINRRGVLPTGRVAMLGRWTQPAIARPDLKRLMQSLGRITGQTIVLGVPFNIFIRYIDAVPGRLAMRLELPVGTRLPILASGMGALLLAQMEDEEIADAHRRTTEAFSQFGPDGIRASEIADLWNENPEIPPLATLMKEIDAIRARGYAMTADGIALGAGIICTALPTNHGEQPLGLGVAGLSAMIERDRDMILDAIIDEGRKLDIAVAIKRGPQGRT